MYRYIVRVYIITPGFGLSPLKYSINRRWAAEIMTTCIHNIRIHNITYIYYIICRMSECVCVGVRIRFWNDPRLTPIICCGNIILIYVRVHRAFGSFFFWIGSSSQVSLKLPGNRYRCSKTIGGHHSLGATSAAAITSVFYFFFFFIFYTPFYLCIRTKYTINSSDDLRGIRIILRYAVRVYSNDCSWCRYT